MLLDDLEIQNFRNLEGKVAFGNKLNILIGENGQGKTNWLEAIYLLANAKSFKTSKLTETIRFNETNAAFIRGSVRQSEEISRIVQITLENNSKILTMGQQTKVKILDLCLIQVSTFMVLLVWR